MSDFLLELGQNPNARKLIKTLGLPLPIPQTLRRADGPWEERPLHDYDVAVGAAGKGSLIPVIAETLTGSGANPHVVGEKIITPFVSPGEAYARRPRPLDLAAVPETSMYDGLVFDASDVKDIAGLRAIYDFFHPLIGNTVKCARPISAWTASWFLKWRARRTPSAPRERPIIRPRAGAASPRAPSAPAASAAMPPTWPLRPSRCC